MKLADRDDDVVFADANRWAVELEVGDLSAAEKRQLDEWLATDAAHRKAFEAIQQDIDWSIEVGREVPVRSIAAGRGVESLRRAAKRRHSHKRRRYTTAIATAAAICVAAAIGWFVLTQPEYHEIHDVGIGEQVSVVLPDGSSVDVNTNSAVEILYTTEKRLVTMQRGEAHFQVAADRARPFDVVTDAGIVRAVGTAFNVYLRDDVVEVAVTEGAVEVVPKKRQLPENEVLNEARTATVSEGHKIEFNENVQAVEVVDKDTLARKLAWRQGVLVFTDEPLESVIAEVSRYTTTKLIVTDPDLKRYRIGGVYRAGNVKSLVGMLEAQGIVEARHGSQQVIYLTAGERFSH